MKKTLLTLILITLFGLSLITPVLAQQNGATILEPTVKELDAQNKAFLKASSLKYIPLSVMTAAVIKMVLGFLGVIFVVLIIYAGFLWMTAAGNEENIAKAKKIMAGAIIGTAIVLSAYAITVFIFDNLFASLENSGPTTAGTHTSGS
jgi:hypothetical protein